MKIICESLEEYDKLMAASRYLHDFELSPEDFDDADDDVVSLRLNLDLPMVGFLAHLYLTEDDFPNKDKYVCILNCSLDMEADTLLVDKKRG